MIVPFRLCWLPLFLLGSGLRTRYVLFFAASASGSNRRSRLAFVTTHNDENAIAAPAIIGFSSVPVNGYSTPAAITMPMLL